MAKTGTGGKKADDERASDQPQTQTTTASPDFSETSPANASSTAASPTKLGVNSSVVNPSNLTSQYTALPSNVIPLVNVAKMSPTPKGNGGMLAGTNTDNQYLANESGSIRNAEERRNKYVNQNKFIANPTPQPTAPIPTKIYTRTNLLDQASEDSNPLSILEGNPFVAPAQRFLPQINEEFAPRPELKSFTTDPYIGVHKTSPIAPNSDNEVSQKKGVMDWMQEIRQHKYFPLAIMALIVIVVISILRGRSY